MSIREEADLRLEGQRLQGLGREIKKSTSACDKIIRDLCSWRDGVDHLEPPVAPLLRSLTLLQRIKGNVVDTLWKLRELELVRHLVMEGEEKVKFYFPYEKTSNKRVLQPDLILPFIREIDTLLKSLESLNPAEACETFEEPILQSAYHLLDDQFQILTSTFEDVINSCSNDDSLEYSSLKEFIEYVPDTETLHYKKYLQSLKNVYITSRCRETPFHHPKNTFFTVEIILEWTRKFVAVQRKEEDRMFRLHIPIILERIGCPTIIAAIMEPLSLSIMDACVSIIDGGNGGNGGNGVCNVEDSMWILELYGGMLDIVIIGDDNGKLEQQQQQQQPLLLDDVLMLLKLKSQELCKRIDVLITKNHTLRPPLSSVGGQVSTSVCPYVVSGVDILKRAAILKVMDRFVDRKDLSRRMIVSLEGSLSCYGDQIKRAIVKKLFMINNYSFIKNAFEASEEMALLLDDDRDDGGDVDHIGIVEHYSKVIESLKDQYMEMWMYCMALLVCNGNGGNGGRGVDSKPFPNRYGNGVKALPSAKEQLRSWSTEWSEIVDQHSNCVIVDNVIRMNIVNSLHELVIGHFDQFSKTNPTLWENGSNKALSIEGLAKMIDSLFRA